MSNEEQSVFLTKIMSIILGRDQYFCKSNGFKYLSGSKYFSSDNTYFKPPKSLDLKDDYYVYCLEFIGGYGLYIEEVFNTEYFKKEPLSNPARSTLNAIGEIVSLRDLDKWETIHHNIIEHLNPDVWFHDAKKDWILSLLDDKTSALLKDYFKAIAY